jgi:hypothetical protein
MYNEELDFEHHEKEINNFLSILVETPRPLRVSLWRIITTGFGSAWIRNGIKCS